MISLVGTLLLLCALFSSGLLSYKNPTALFPGVMLLAWVCTPIVMGAAYFFTFNPIFITLWHIPLIAIPTLIGIVYGIIILHHEISIARDKKEDSSPIPALFVGVLGIGAPMSLPIASLIIWLTHPFNFLSVTVASIVIISILSAACLFFWFGIETVIAPYLALASDQSSDKRVKPVTLPDTKEITADVTVNTDEEHDINLNTNNNARYLSSV